MSRAYISRGFRDRAAERVTLELGPRSEREIQSALEREVEAERWTSLDRALRSIADEGVGIADLRPGAQDLNPELRRLMLGRADKLERLGMAERVGPACFTLKPGLEGALRDLGNRGDIIKTMHEAMSWAGREPDVAGFALHGDDPGEPVLGRLVARGLDDELKGSAYAIVEGIDGRTHHLQFADLEFSAMPRPERSSRRAPMRMQRVERGSRLRPALTSPCSSRSQRQVRRGWIGSFSRASRPQREAAASGATSVTPWTVVPNTSLERASLVGKDSASS